MADEKTAEERANSKLEFKVKEIQSQLRDLTSRPGKFSDNIFKTKINMEIKNIYSEIDNVHKMLAELDSEIKIKGENNLKSSMNELNKKIDDVEEDLRKNTGERVDNLEKVLVKKISETKLLAEEGISKNETRSAGIEQRIADMESNINSNTKNINDSLRTVNESVENLKKSVSEKEKQLAVLNAKIAELEKNETKIYDELSTLIRSLQKELGDFEGRIAVGEKSLADLDEVFRMRLERFMKDVDGKLEFLRNRKPMVH